MRLVTGTSLCMSRKAQLSHSLRTPLTSIRLVVELLARKGDELSAEMRRDFLLTAIEQTKKLEIAILEAEHREMGVLAEDEADVIVLHEESAEPETLTIRGAALRSAPPD